MDMVFRLALNKNVLGSAQKLELLFRNFKFTFWIGFSDNESRACFVACGGTQLYNIKYPKYNWSPFIILNIFVAAYV